MKEIPQKYADLLSDQKKAFASIATTMPDGSPQVTPVWFDTAGAGFASTTRRDAPRRRI